MNKYHNKKTVVDGIKFDSAKEANRYKVLKYMEEQGEIAELHLQPKYVLQEGFTNATWGKQRPIIYKADFEYRKDDKTIVEDVKGMKTQVYKIKKKMFLLKYPNVIFKEV